MGFRQNAYLKIWSVEPKSDTMTKLRVSSSKKNKKTEEYETDFSGFVVCVGTACASKAAKLSNGDRIKIVDCDVTNRYDKEKKVTYTDFKIFNFEPANSSGGSSGSPYEPQPEVDDGEVDSRLPF